MTQFISYTGTLDVPPVETTGIIPYTEAIIFIFFISFLLSVLFANKNPDSNIDDYYYPSFITLFIFNLIA